MSKNTELFHPWSLEYCDYDSQKEKSRESLLAIGNGYLGSRGALEESGACDTNYPGTYIAGLYNRLISKVGGKDIENEDLVNIPNWLYLNFRIDEGDWLDINSCKIVSISRKLEFKTGELSKIMEVEDKQGRRTAIESKRISSMANPHLLAIQYCLRPLNYSATIEIESKLDGNIINDGVARYRDLNQHHLTPDSQEASKNGGWLKVKTIQSDIEIVEAVKHTVNKNHSFECKIIPGEVSTLYKSEIQQNENVILEKVVTIYTSKPDDVNNPLECALNDLKIVGSYDEILEESKKAWTKIWDTMDIQIEGDTKSQMLVRLHSFHMMVSASPVNATIDAGIAARGLHGEAYRGHIFWDELYILPYYSLFFPEVTKSVLKYRYKRINEARKYAQKYGYKGAMYPWQSGSDGREETQIIHLNPISGEWGDDYSSLQRHISIAIAYNVWYYFQITDDIAFMEEYGMEVFLEICRFWASKCVKDENGRYSIPNVMGPDEFHETNDNTEGGGVTDNAYTNIMVAWLFKKASVIMDKLSQTANDIITSKINLSEKELDDWNVMSLNLNIPLSEDGIIEQFKGYFALEELDWDAYRKKYGNIHRLDRILKAEGKSPDDYKLAKQADTLMTFYNINEDDISSIIKDAGYSLPDDYLKKNYEYYLNRTSHGSTLSRVVHSYLANMFGNKEYGNKFYYEALQSDYNDIQGGTTAEGIHAGVMGATVLMIITSYAGIDFKNDLVEIKPSLPKEWDALKFSFCFKGNKYLINLLASKLEIEIKSENSDEIGVVFMNKKIFLQPNSKEVLNY